MFEKAKQMYRTILIEGEKNPRAELSSAYESHIETLKREIEDLKSQVTKLEEKLYGSSVKNSGNLVNQPKPIINPSWTVIRRKLEQKFAKKVKNV